MAKKPTITSRKSRFEMLEDRRLLTTWNIDAKFVSNGLTNAGGDTDGGEAAFGDTATQTAAQLHSTYNNNAGTGTPSATDSATSASPWTFGVLDSGPAAFSNSVPYTFTVPGSNNAPGTAYIDPNSFDNFLSGSAGAGWSPGYAGGDLDGVQAGYDGVAGYYGGTLGETAVFYSYGNSGLNGDGGGGYVQSPFGDDTIIPAGTVAESGVAGPVAAMFTAPTTGNYTLTTTLTNPDFDPYDGPKGGNGGNDAWTWSSADEPGGQPQYLIYKVPAGSTSTANTSSLLDSGFYEDIASVNQADLPSPGNSINSSDGLSINTGTATGAYIQSHDVADVSYNDTDLPLAVNNGSFATNLYSYGTGGTWTLTNVGPYLNGNTANPEDTSGDQYDISWTVTQTVSLHAGDSIQIDSNAEYLQGQSDADFTDPTYIAASVSPAASSPAPPVVTTSGSTGQTFTLGGSAVAVDSGISVTSSDTDITGASETITNYQSGDSLIYTPIDGITIASNSGGVLNLTGSATPAQYTAALQSVTFSTTSINQTTRTIDVVADDSAASPTTSNTGVDTVKVAIAPPVVTAHQTSVNDTAGQTVTVDAPVTVTSFDTDVTGATMTIGTGYQSGSDTLHFTTQNGITGVYSGGVLTLSGSATPAQYQTALASVTFSSTSASTATRNISIVVNDSGDTGNVSSNTATTQIVVSAPVTITAAYVSGSAWTTPTFSNTTERFDTYLVNKGLGDATIPTVGYALQTGANQLIPLPWANVNTISVTFSGAVSDIGLGSLKLVGGTGTGSVAAPSVTGFTSDGSNTYSWTLASSLGNNKYVFAIATTGSSFGTAGSTQVVDANGAGISGTFTTGQAFPSGNGFAGSTFDFFFDLLPGDGNRATTSTSSADTALAKSVNNQHETSATYNPYVDYDGAGIDSATDVAFNGSHNNVHNSTLTSPTAPSDSSGVGTTGFTALALGVQETGSSSSSSPAATVSNVVSASPSSAGTTSTSTGSTGTGGTGSSTTTTSTSSRDHAHHQFAANDEAVSEFDLADLYV